MPGCKDVFGFSSFSILCKEAPTGSSSLKALQSRAVKSWHYKANVDWLCSLCLLVLLWTVPQFIVFYLLFMNAIFPFLQNNLRQNSAYWVWQQLCEHRMVFLWVWSVPSMNTEKLQGVLELSFTNKSWLFFFFFSLKENSTPRNIC